MQKKKDLEHCYIVLRRKIIRPIMNNQKLSYFISKHCLKTYMAMFYENWIGKRMNFRHPKDFNQILMAQSYAHSKDPEMRRLIPMCTDKYAVREFIESKGYGDILNELYGVYDNVDDIDFDALPDQFVMKMNNACGRNWICTDKSKADWPTIKEQFREWLKDHEFAWFTGEWQYALIQPRIVVEKYLKDLGDESLVDYKLHVVRGKACGFFVCYNRDNDIMHEAATRQVCFDSYDIDWNRTEDIQPQWHPVRVDIPKPQTLKRIIEIAEDCCKEFPYCRFDVYEVNGKIIFGEMTFTPHGNVLNYYTDEFLKRMEDVMLSKQ